MSFTKYRNSLLTIGTLLLASGQAYAQSVQQVTFLGPDCTASNSTSVGKPDINNLKFSFDEFGLTQSKSASALNTVHCKIELLTKLEKGYALRLKGMDVHLSGVGADGFTGLIQTTLFDGERIRFSSPVLTKINSQSLPNKAHIKRIGIGKSASYCYGDTIPYQITLILKADNADGIQKQGLGEIKVDAIDNIEMEKIKCEERGE